MARAEGGFAYDEHRYKLVDLPGTYSLLSTSPDEEIARDFILFGQPDVTVIVVDAVRLERNLNLVLQVLEITDRAVIALNLIDQARRHQVQIDDRRLARDLGVPVVPTSARYGEGKELLLKTIGQVATGATVCRPRRVRQESPAIQRMLSELLPQIEAAFPELPNPRWVALRLLDGDKKIISSFSEGRIGQLRQVEKTDEGHSLEDPS